MNYKSYEGTVKYEKADTVESASVAWGRVIRQSVKAKEEVKEGTQVTLTVSIGTKEINEKTNAEVNQNQKEGTPEKEQPGSQEKIPEKTEQDSQNSQQNTENYVWSDWVTELPANIDKAKYQIETKQQYRFRDKTTMSSSNSAEDGWTLYDTTTTKGGFGEWSAWGTEKPAEVSDRETESKKQYAYSDYQTATQNDNKSMSGWTLDDSKTKVFYNNDYGSWSAWSETAVNKSDNRNVETRDVVKYRYRTREWKSQNNNSAAPAGYTVDSSRTTVSYGEWSAETETPAVASATLDVTASTREVQVGSKTMYKYYCYRYYNTSAGKYYYTYANVSGSTYYEFSWESPLPYRDTYDGYAGYYSYQANVNAGMFTDTLWFSAGTYEVPIMENKTFYQTRPITTTYYFYKWNDWSNWSENVEKGDSNKQVENQTVKQYRYQDRPTHYTYTFYRWTPYSAFSDTYVEKTSTRQVKEQTIYRYRDKQDIKTYHYYKWGAWSEWRDEKVDSSDAREVDAPRTLYRYKQK